MFEERELESWEEFNEYDLKDKKRLVNTFPNVWLRTADGSLPDLKGHFTNQGFGVFELLNVQIVFRSKHNIKDIVAEDESNVFVVIHGV